MAEEVVSLKGRQFVCKIRKNRLAKSLRLSVSARNDIRVTIPYYSSFKAAKAFLQKNIAWLEDQIKEDLPNSEERNLEYKKFKKNALKIITERVLEINKFYQLPFKKISIRNQTSRWGSCSSNGTLSFNYKIALLPRKYTDYVIAHELCHLREMNHSERFWNLVAEKVPDYKAIRKEIKKIAQIQ